jgi:hypothetical protein
MKNNGKFLMLMVLFFGVASWKTPQNSANPSEIYLYRDECKELIKPFRYVGSTVTFFSASNKRQQKNVDVVFDFDKDYVLAFSGKASNAKFTINIYSIEENSKDRLLLAKFKSINDSNIVVDLECLNRFYKEKRGHEVELRELSINYEMEKCSAQEVIIMVKGSQKKKSDHAKRAQ